MIGKICNKLLEEGAHVLRTLSRKCALKSTGNIFAGSTIARANTTTVFNCIRSKHTIASHTLQHNMWRHRLLCSWATTWMTSEYVRDIVPWRKCGADRRKSRAFRRPIAARFSAVRFRLLRRTEASTRRPLKPQTTLRYGRALRRGKEREKPQIAVKITKTRTFWVGSRSPGVVAIVEGLVVESAALLRAQVHPFLAFLRWKNDAIKRYISWLHAWNTMFYS